MRLCEMKGRFLFEANPRIFNEGHVGALELIAWGAYYEMQKTEN